MQQSPLLFLVSSAEAWHGEKQHILLASCNVLRCHPRKLPVKFNLGQVSADKPLEDVCQPVESVRVFYVLKLYTGPYEHVVASLPTKHWYCKTTPIADIRMGGILKVTFISFCLLDCRMGTAHKNITLDERYNRSSKTWC